MTTRDEALAARLTAAMTREEAIRRATLLAYPPHDDPLYGQKGAKVRRIADALLSAVAEERERCAKIAEAGANLMASADPLRFVSSNKCGEDLARDIADAIRAEPK